jgi:hypothetical protein
MVETALVGEFVPEAAVLAGRELLKQLDRTKLNVRAALWIRLDEKTTWTLELATPLVKSEGPRRVYSTVQQALRKLPPSSHAVISIADVRVTAPDDALLSKLRLEVKTAPTAIVGITLRKNVINGEMFPDCYVYRNA